MAGWMTLRVELVSGGGSDFDPGPGRIFLVGPDHTFGEVAEAINLHFGRWDLSHLHSFRLADGREIGFTQSRLPQHARSGTNPSGVHTRQGRRVRVRLRLR
jgi:hypothetical protein